jgi:hypothetical protein
LASPQACRLQDFYAVIEIAEQMLQALPEQCVVVDDKNAAIRLRVR